MKGWAIAFVAVLLSANILAVVGAYMTTPSEAEIEAIARRVVAERESQLMQEMRGNLNRMETEFGLEPSSPQSIEGVLQAISRIVFMPAAPHGE